MEVIGVDKCDCVVFSVDKINQIQKQVGANSIKLKVSHVDHIFLLDFWRVFILTTVTN